MFLLQLVQLKMRNEELWISGDMDDALCMVRSS